VDGSKKYNKHKGPFAMTEHVDAAHLFTLDPARRYPTLVRGQGVYVYDDQGRQYLDAVAGIAAVAVGYGRKRVAAAMGAQALALPYAAPNIFGNLPAIQLAQRIAGHMPGDCTSIHFTSGGSEAVEAAIKIARQMQVERGLDAKEVLIARETSYHGATLGALSATGFAGRRKKFLPLLNDWPHIPAAYCYRCAFGRNYPACDLACALALEKQILALGADRVMGFIAEPVVGAAGGALVPPPEYWPLVREICTRHDVLLIADEVLTGFGRTGRFLAVEHWHVQPDLITLAKGLSSGYAPLGAVAVSRKIRSVFEEQAIPLDHVFTFSGHPVACAAASAALEILEKENLVQQAAETGAYLFERLEALREFAIVGDIRGRGLLAGIELVRERDSREPFAAQAGVAKRVGQIALQKGLVLYPSGGMLEGGRGDVICLFPPLTFQGSHVDELIDLLHSTLVQAQNELRMV
jgi:adenosylmethionine-8-amino-7-oxononanoate aminotransferase